MRYPQRKLPPSMRRRLRVLSGFHNECVRLGCYRKRGKLIANEMARAIQKLVTMRNDRQIYK